MSNQPTLILGLTVDAVFKKIEERINEDGQKELTEEELLQLNSIFEKVLLRALDLIDNKKIVLYKYQESGVQGFREILEIVGHNNEVYRFFPKINYCPCLAYQFQVIRDQNQWTCKHILAAKIAKLLGLIEVEVLTKIQFDYLLKQIRCF